VHSPNNEFEGGCLIQGKKTTIECAKSVAFFMVGKLKGHSPKYHSVIFVHFFLEVRLGDFEQFEGGDCISSCWLMLV
jgi:hypothetical protein